MYPGPILSMQSPWSHFKKWFHTRSLQFQGQKVVVTSKFAVNLDSPFHLFGNVWATNRPRIILHNLKGIVLFFLRNAKYVAVRWEKWSPDGALGQPRTGKVLVERLGWGASCQRLQPAWGAWSPWDKLWPAPFPSSVPTSRWCKNQVHLSSFRSMDKLRS